MKSAILRGFDFPARDASDQLRFCNPLLSFEEGQAAPIHFARDLDWSHGSGDQSGGLTPVDIDEVESFGTLVSLTSVRVSQGEGVVLMGKHFVDAVRMVGIELDHGRFAHFTELPEIRCWVGVAGIHAFRAFARHLTCEAASVFDDELSAVTDGEIPERGRASLFLLRKCGLTRPTDLVIRQLTAALVTRQTDTYRRLLLRFSIELEETEDNLHQRVERHIRVARPAAATGGRSRSRPERDLEPVSSAGGK